jgi:hypothetical protein
MLTPVGAEMIRALALRDSGEHLGIASGPGKPGLFADAAEISEHGAQPGFDPGFGQLLYWRPVPGFAPSAATFAASVRLMDQLRGAFAAAVQAGAPP